MKPLRLFSSGRAREMVDTFERLLRQRRLTKSPEQARLAAMLMHGLLFGKPDQVRKVLAAGADPDSRFPRGTALGEAIHHERPGMVRALLDGGADPDLPSNKKLPLAMACEQGLTAIIDLLVEAGANVKGLGDYMKPALLDAAACGCVPLARKLLDAGVPIDFRGKHGRGIYASAALPRTWQTPLMLAAFYPWTLHFVWKLLHNDPGTLGLIANNPFPDTPPRYIRAQYYRYQFAPPGDPTGAWWKRPLEGSWLPPLSTDSTGLLRFLSAYGWTGEEGGR